MSENTIHVTDLDFDKRVLGADRPVLVDFWAEWCGPCKMVAPIVEKIANERPDSLIVAKLNIDESPLIAERYGIMSIPTLVVFNSGAAVEGTIGALPYEPLNEWIGNLMEQFETESTS